MCDFSNGIKLCTCNGDKIKYRKPEFLKKIKGEYVKIPNKKNDNIPLIYIWHLFRYHGKDLESASLGQYMFPTSHIGDGLNAEWIALNLNVENCFDFDYAPNEGDNLFITQNTELSPYISFIFKNKEWIVENYNPLSDITKLILTGKILSIN